MPAQQRTDAGFSSARIGYHPEIEGLRAIAVVSVVLSHARVPGFSGGYIGVDLFFVISGYLICRMLFGEMERTGGIRLLPFWARRIRRLLPNATLTLLFVLSAGLWLVPGFMRDDVAKDVAMSVLQVSNYHFAGKAVDYFRQDDFQSPVLHFWSLAVEEQFYIVWPAMLAVLCIVLGRKSLLVSRVLLVITCAASLAGMLQAITFSQPVAFFHSWARAWQLGMGGLLAVAYNAGGGRALPRRTSDAALQAFFGVLGWTGLGVVLASIYLLDEDTLYPGLHALPPTLGAAAIVAAVTLGKQTSWGVGAMLSVAPLRWIGTRSYSWYLWHWPFLILTEMAYPNLAGVRMIAAAASLAVAGIVYTFIEDPIRSGLRSSMSAGRTALLGLASILLVGAASAGFARFPDPGGAEVAMRNGLIAEAARDRGQVYRDKCHIAVEVTQQPDCEYGKPGGRPRVVLFGDSHAAQWFPAIDAAAAAEGWSLRSWTKSSCSASDVRIWYPPRRAAFHECDVWREAVMAELTGPNRPDVVVVSSLLDYSGWIASPTEPGRLLRKTQTEPVMREGFQRTVQRLLDAGVAVIVVRDTPRMNRSFARCFVSDGGPACDLSRERALAKPWIDVQVVRTFPDTARIRLLDLTDQICEPRVCRVVRNGEVIWADRHHLRASHAARQSEHFRRALRAMNGTQSR